MKKIISFVLLAALSASLHAGDLVREIDQQQFTDRIGEFDGRRWHSDIRRPAIVDFNADWCGPCRRLAPVLEELAAERTDIDFFSVNVDSNKELAKQLHIASIPFLLIIPTQGEPQAIVGVKPKSEILQTIEAVIDGKQPTEE